MAAWDAGESNFLVSPGGHGAEEQRPIRILPACPEFTSIKMSSTKQDRYRHYVLAQACSCGVHDGCCYAGQRHRESERTCNVVRGD